jgi:hypothetical protein
MRGSVFPEFSESFCSAWLECEGMDRLAITVRDELKRTWARETRLEREQKGLEGLTPQLSGKYAQGA